MAKEEKIAPTKINKSRKKNSARWFLIGLFFFVLILCLVFFSSSVSRVQKIEIKGNVMISQSDILKASKVALQDQFLFVTRNGTANKIHELNAFEKVTINKDFPGYIQIVVKEYPHVAYMIQNNGKYQALLANGRRLNIENPLMDKPILRGWDKSKFLSNMTRAMNQVKAIHLKDFSEIIPEPSKTYPDKIKIYTRSGYEVRITIKQFSKKIIYLQNVIENLKAEEKNDGYIYMLDSTYHQPFFVDQNTLDLNNDN